MHELLRGLTLDTPSSLGLLNSLLQVPQPLLSCLLVSCAKPELSVTPLNVDAASGDSKELT